MMRVKKYLSVSRLYPGICLDLNQVVLKCILKLNLFILCLENRGDLEANKNARRGFV